MVRLQRAPNETNGEYADRLIQEGVIPPFAMTIHADVYNALVTLLAQRQLLAQIERGEMKPVAIESGKDEFGNTFNWVRQR